MAYTHPKIGDRVRFAKDLGGHLKQGCLGIVWEIDQDPEDGARNDFPLGVIIPWVREQAPAPADLGAWTDGRIAKSQFQSTEMIPMHPSELEYIDNVMTGGD